MKKNKTKHPVDIINLWERLELRLVGDGETAGFITRVEDIDNDCLTVENPIRISGSRELAPGQHLQAVVNKNDAAYAFEVIIADINAQKENLTALKVISEVKRTQRRKFVRIDIAGDITFRLINKNQTGQNILSPEHRGELLNISAGGILVETAEGLNQGDLMLMNFWMKNNSRLENILGIVKRIEPGENPDDHAENNLVGIEFLAKEKSADSLPAGLLQHLPLDIKYFDEALQQLIVQFVYKQQVESKKKQKA